MSSNISLYNYLMLTNWLDQTSWTGIVMLELFSSKKKGYMFLKNPIPLAPDEDVGEEVRNTSTSY